VTNLISWEPVAIEGVIRRDGGAAVMLRGKRGGERHKGTGFSNDRRTFEAITAKSRLKLPGEDGRGKREQRSKLSQQQQCQRVEKVAAQVSFAKSQQSGPSLSGVPRRAKAPGGQSTAMAGPVL
jgi:hypothetical protein